MVLSPQARERFRTAHIAACLVSAVIGFSLAVIIDGWPSRLFCCAVGLFWLARGYYAYRK